MTEGDKLFQMAANDNGPAQLGRKINLSRGQGPYRTESENTFPATPSKHNSEPTGQPSPSLVYNISEASIATAPPPPSPSNKSSHGNLSQL